ncbi:hypothetical protein [Bdellovibrio bacteriovorus]|uniref:hypothetical protein n=1 Tax=Bdellovibrio TaxID=958 RepID=UPI0035A8949B
MFSKKAVLALASLLAAHSVAQAEEFWQRPFYYEREIEEAPSALASSLVPQEKMGTIVRLDFLSSAEVPALFRQFLPGENFDRPRGVSIYLALTNDYNVLRPVGVKAETDDNGYTHGTKMAIGGFLPDGHYLSLEYSTDLYTKQINGEAKKLADGGRYVDQNFTTENVLKIVLDNVDNARGKVFYWRVEGGWQRLNSQAPGNFFTSGATQQEKFHALVNSARAGQTKTPTNIDDGKGIRDGAILGLYVGVAKEYLNAKNSCRVRAFAEGGSQGSTLSDASFLAAKFGSALWCQVHPKSLTFKAEAGHESKAFRHGYQGTAYADISTGKGKWRVGFRIEQSHGDLINYVNYNLKNMDNGKIDPLFMIYYRYYFSN